jgi:hypothetical protein
VYQAFDPWRHAYWLAFYELALPIAGLPRSAKLDALANAVTELGWWIPMKGAVVMSPRPVRLGRDARGQLHGEDGPALVYPDGWSLWFWHGRPVPQWVVEAPEVARIASEENVEVRRCAIESLGWDRFVREAELKPVRPAGSRTTCLSDPGNPGQTLTLYDVPRRLWGSHIRLLLCVNGSTERDGTRRRYGLTVPATIKDPVQAAAWTAGLTANEYARMQRRT